jgi:catechol 2,3-dioxygenase-like lactoylglutathione lyase family enzyme
MAEKPKIRFQRANFVVSDIDRALTFYRDVLGFEVTFRKAHNPESYSFPVFEIPKNAEIGFCILSAPNQPRIMALTQIAGVTMEPVPFPRRGAIVLEMADPDETIEGAKELGLHVYEESRLVTGDGRVGREIGIVDFDGNLILIYLITGKE